MKYLKEAPFMAINGSQFQVIEDSGTPVPATVGRVTRLCLERYQPQQGKMLDTGDLRWLNKAIDKLVADVPGDGYFAFEQIEFEIVRRVVGWMAPVLIVRNAPALDDALNQASETRP